MKAIPSNTISNLSNSDLVQHGHQVGSGRVNVPKNKEKLLETFEKIKDKIVEDSIKFEKLTNMLSGKQLTGQELLKVQIQVHQIGLRVEMVGKIAEGANNIVKRMQS